MSIDSKFVFEEDGMKHPLNLEITTNNQQKFVLIIEAHFRVPEINEESPVERYQALATKYDVIIYSGGLSSGGGKPTVHSITVRHEVLLEVTEWHPYLRLEDYAERFVKTAKNLLIELTMRNTIMDNDDLATTIAPVKKKIDVLYEKVKNDAQASDILSTIDYAQRQYTEITEKSKNFPATLPEL